MQFISLNLKRLSQGLMEMKHRHLFSQARDHPGSLLWLCVPLHHTLMYHKL